MKYDVIVVGGRIGGSISSLFASKNDLNVLMIEKRQEIGVPLQCAEATSEETFETIGMKPSKRYVCSEIFGADLYSPDGTQFRMMPYGNERGFILDRKVFDKSLAIESAKAGTDIMIKTAVKDLIIRNGEVKGVIVKHLGKIMEIEADLVIGADGIESNIARMAGLKSAYGLNDICSCVQYKMVGIDVESHYMQFYFGRKIAPGGYLWIFPSENGVTNVGIGIRSSKETAYQYLHKFISNLGGTPVELNVGGVPVSGNIKKTYTDGLMIVGDAAGHVDPITGGGIQLTAACAKIAGEVAAESIKNEDTSARFLKVYEKRWKDQVGGVINQSIKYRNVMDKLSDDEFNALARFLKDRNIWAIPKREWFGLLKESPSLFKLIRAVI
ncbi:NAD(P)/FAD-dependent oxidoreductase [Methanobacterium sp.]|uniref:NAD(P)/FAD-dependent oxidoreductase n=1 Tax=Methanobacterium sp. TaxID=2164 RepID=UPI003C741B28